MMKKRKTVHLICNSHIDPVWLWLWEEGVAETVSTFRTAAEICEENDTFIFNHNEVILYQWIQEYDPALFKRIQKLVKAGKWNIMGGWFLQPDCNMPSGESFVRQILLGRNYFKKHFGVAPKTALNFDPFGHTQGLVQILAKSGYDSYLFGRPEQEDCSLPADKFTWVGYDGSEITGHRFRFPYASPLGRAREKTEKWIAEDTDSEVLTVLWGVGNHGGGPSRRDIRDITRLIEQRDDCRIVHSSPDGFFKDLHRSKRKLPRHNKDLNSWAPGCYTSMVRIKQKHRQLENEIYSAEKMACAAACQGLMQYPRQQFRDALEDLLTGEFHDILPGSCIAPAEEDSLRMFAHGLEIVSRIKAKAFFALAGGQRCAKNGQIPILVYNPHPFKVRTMVECEFNLADADYSETFTHVQVYKDGKAIASQVEQELSSVGPEWRKRVAFEAELEAGQMNRFDCGTEVLKKRPALKLKAGKNRIVFKTDDLDVIINTRTGLIDRYRVKGVDHLGRNSFEPIVVTDNEDSWGVTLNNLKKDVGKFTLMSKKAGTEYSGIRGGIIDSVRVIEDGAARSVVEAVLSYGKSFICQRYKLPKKGSEIEVETTVHFNEKDRMLKLAVPTVYKDSKYIGQVAYGTGQLPGDGKEAVAQKWTAVVSRKDNKALTCINEGTYGSDMADGCMRLSLLRSPGYSAHSSRSDLNFVYIPQGRYNPRIDQGERVFKFWFNAGKVSQRLARIDREALVKNEKPFALSFFPSGGGRKPRPLAVLSDDVVQITTIKLAENSNDVIVRLFEPTGRKRSTVLSLPFIKKKVKLTLGRFEIKTLRINASSGKVTETNLLEKPIRKE